MVRVQFPPQEPLGSRIWFTRTGVQHSPGSSAIEPPYASAESGAYPPDRALPGSLGQCSLPLACRHLPKGTKLGLGRGAHLGKPSSANHTTTVSQTDRLSREDSELPASLEGDPGPTPTGKDLPHSYPETKFRRKRAQYVWMLLTRKFRCVQIILHISTS